ncbi:ATP-binding protein [Tahibacter sp.]|uniref:AAA family ATPase n=1 Tax=Tahibacter sp. TaxID=2056211 RepID=UPI0028C49EDA|nr:ATP-binding protein [Tahibacter sp.]
MSASLRPLALEPAAFTPGLHGHDALGGYWLSQATLRLRREIGWLWRERSLQGADGGAGSALPPTVDRALAALDLQRYERDKRTFFTTDPTARHLGERIAASAPAVAAPVRGSFAWLVHDLALAPVDCFVLALALLPAADAAAGAVIGSCLNETARTAPTLALAQRLWDDPDALLRCFDPGHALLRHGVLLGTADWHAPLAVPPLVARELLFAGSELPQALQRVAPAAACDGDASALARAAASLQADTATPHRRRILPLLGTRDAPLAAIAATCAAHVGLDLVRPDTALSREHLPVLMTVAWLRGCALYLSSDSVCPASGHDHGGADLPLPGLPLVVFVGLHERSQLGSLGATLPPLSVAALDYAQRLACWQELAPAQAPELRAELARRFRYERRAIERLAAQIRQLDCTDAASVFATVRADLDLGSLAQLVPPRFRLDELMLPSAQAAQISELVTAMHNLTRVHYDWGTARPWNEGGLAALFAGPPGTGKTMAAEALAAELGLPLYRIDLSQVVNKYIGETEKNLRRLFDAADAADLILFFDEADAMFGKRTEVKDAHDRYANLEISYLLERMERFKGMAILATNRRKDLDEAFLRRLRSVIEFPLPGVAERERIWRSVIPPQVDASALDFAFLAQRFALAGGHIRAIVFQACLQSAQAGAARRLDMPAVVRAVQREYDKLERAHSLDQFGPYAPLIAAQRSSS